MTYASIERSKYMVAAQVAGGIAFACLDRVSPVGLLGTGQRELRVNPSLSKDEVMQWLVKLRRFRVGERTTLARRITPGSTRAFRTAPSCSSRSSRRREEGDVGALKLPMDSGVTIEVVATRVRDPKEQQRGGDHHRRPRRRSRPRGFVTHGGRVRSTPQRRRDMAAPRGRGTTTC